MEIDELYDAFGLDNPSEREEGVNEQVTNRSPSGREGNAELTDENRPPVGNLADDTDIEDEVKDNEEQPEAEETPESGGAKDEDIGAKEQETAEPDKSKDKDPQSPEENAKYAAARRKAEQEKAEALEAKEREADELVAGLGITNPYTGEVIKTKAEYDSYQRDYAEDKKKDFMESHELSPAQYEAYINELPEVKEAKQAKAEAERQQAEARTAEIKLKIDEEIAEIGKLEPSIKSMEDLSKHESHDKVHELVSKGYSIIDAFKLANFDELASKKSNAAKQQALNSVRSKEHLKKTAAQGGEGLQPVPDDVMELYQSFMPGAMNEEIVRHYNKEMRDKNV